MSGITLRYQIKPSVLRIHKYRVPNEGTMIPLNEEPDEHNAAGNLDTSEPSGIFNSHSYSRPSRIGKSVMSFSRLTVRPFVAAKNRSASTLSLKSADVSFFCDWIPQLFGVDEDNIPSSEEEEEILGGEDTVESRVAVPKYGRRSGRKQSLLREDGEKFECICDVDETFDRQYIPHFGGGIKSEKEDWRVPHFSSFWDDYKESLDVAEDASLMKLVDHKTLQETDAEEKKIVYQRPQPKFISPNIQEARKQVLNSLRPLTCRELRRNRMPFPDAIILELEEDGYLETAAFLKSLLIEEYQLDQLREPCPTIRESRTKILKLVKLLTAVERKGRKQESNAQSIFLLKTGKYFSEAEETWWWLAERLFEKAVQVSSKYVIDGGKSEAIARYIYGVFLLDYEVDIKQTEICEDRVYSFLSENQDLIKRDDPPVYFQ